MRAVLAGQPDPPRYFAEMKRINRDGPRVLGGQSPPPRLDAAALDAALAAGATVVDTRAGSRLRRIRAARDAQHSGRPQLHDLGRLAAAVRSGLLPDRGRPRPGIDALVRALAGIGLDRVAGYADGRVIGERQRDELQTIPGIDLAELTTAMAAGGVALLDVRARGEWDAGHLPGAVNIPLGELEQCLGALPRGRPLVIHCQTGARAAIGASLLCARGVPDVRLYGGGFSDWRAAGREVVVAG